MKEDSLTAQPLAVKGRVWFNLIKDLESHCATVCYLKRSIMIVVSPLLALMTDQVNTMSKRGLLAKSSFQNTIYFSTTNTVNYHVGMFTLLRGRVVIWVNINMLQMSL